MYGNQSKFQLSWVFLSRKQNFLIGFGYKCFQQLPGGEKALVIFKLKLNNSINFFLVNLKIKSPPPLLRMSPTFNKPINFRVNLSLFERENYFIVHPKKSQFITFTLIKKGLNFIDKLLQTF